MITGPVPRQDHVLRVQVPVQQHVAVRAGSSRRAAAGRARQGRTAGTWWTRSCSRASSRGLRPDGPRPAAEHVKHRRARRRAPSRCRHPETSKTSGTGTPDARACIITWASAATRAASRPSRYRRSTRPSPMSYDVRVPPRPEQRPRHLDGHAPSLSPRSPARYQLALAPRTGPIAVPALRALTPTPVSRRGRPRPGCSCPPPGRRSPG